MVTPTTPATDEVLATAREAARVLAARPGVAAAFLAGSLVEGLGNATSDVDLYLAGPDLVASRRQLGRGPTRLDVHELPSAALESCVTRALSPATASDADPPPATRDDLALAARILTAEPVRGAAWLSGLAGRLRERRLDLLRQSVGLWAAAARGALQDVAGARAAGDLDTAALVGRDALVAAGKAVAAACGDLYATPKWVCRQLARSAPDGFPQERFGQLVRSDLLASERGCTLDGLAELAQTCLAAATTLGWHGVPLARWPAWGGDGGQRRAAGFVPQPYADGVVVTRPAERRVRLAHDVALVWGLCDGAPDEDELVSRAGARRAAAPAYARLDPDRCRDVLALLAHAGLLVVGPPR